MASMSVDQMNIQCIGAIIKLKRGRAVA